MLGVVILGGEGGGYKRLGGELSSLPVMFSSLTLVPITQVGFTVRKICSSL